MTDSGFGRTNDPSNPSGGAGGDPSQPSSGAGASSWETPESGPANPFSREGGQTGDAYGTEPTRPLSPESQWPGYPGYDPQSMPQYGSGTGYDPAAGQYANYGTSSPYEVNPYQPTPYAYTAQNHPQAVTAFVLGLLGLVICPPVGIGGLVVGGRVRREIDASGGAYQGRGLATAGWVLGIISVVYLALMVVVVIIAVIGGAFSGPS